MASWISAAPGTGYCPDCKKRTKSICGRCAADIDRYGRCVSGEHEAKVMCGKCGLGYNADKIVAPKGEAKKMHPAFTYDQCETPGCKGLARGDLDTGMFAQRACVKCARQATKELGTDKVSYFRTDKRKGESTPLERYVRQVTEAGIPKGKEPRKGTCGGCGAKRKVFMPKGKGKPMCANCIEGKAVRGIAKKIFGGK